MNWDFIYRGETDCLDETSRQGLGGSFARLPLGQTHYELSGPEKDRTAVLIHGFSAGFFVWDPTYTALIGEQVRTLRYDLYGRGYSDRPRRPNNLSLFVDQLRDLLRHLAIEQVDLVGLSMGGPIAAAYAVEFTDKVRRLVLIDPVSADPVPLRAWYRALLLPGIGEVVGGLAGSGGLLRGVASDIFGPVPGGDFEKRYLQQMRFKGFKRSLLSSARNGMLDGFRELYEHLGGQSKPVLLIWGRDDRAVPVEQSRPLLELLPGAVLRVIEGCGHTPHYEQPGIVNPLILDFLRPT